MPALMAVRLCSMFCGLPWPRIGLRPNSPFPSSLPVCVLDTCRQPYQITSEKGYGFLFSMMDLDTSHDLDSLVRLKDCSISRYVAWKPFDRYFLIQSVGRLSTSPVSIPVACVGSTPPRLFVCLCAL